MYKIFTKKMTVEIRIAEATMNVFGAVLFFHFCTVAISLHADLNDVFELYFRNEPTLQAYFCSWKDALKTAQFCARRGSCFLNAKKFPSSHFLDVDGITFGPKHPQHMGVFVDIRCHQGRNFLLQCSNFFNASYTWLMWTDDVDESLALIETSRVSVDSQVAFGLFNSESTVLVDVYRYHVDGPLIVKNLALSESKACSTSLCRPRRNNYQGYQLTASSVLTEFPWKGREGSENSFMDPLFAPNVAGMRRYGYSLFYLLSNLYNFEFDVKMYKYWAKVYPNGTGTGMLKDLIEGTRDFGLAPSKYIPERLDSVSFLGVLGSVKFTFIFRQPSAQGSITALVAPMSSGAWCGLVVSSVACGVVLWLILERDDTIQNPYKGSESFLITVSTVSQNGLWEVGSKPSTQVALITLLVMTFLAHTLYNSSVLNGLLIKAPDAIQNIHQLLKSDLKIASYDVGYLRDQMASNDSVSQKFWQKMMKNENPYFKLEEGLKLVHTGRYAFYVLDDDFFRAAHQLFTVEEICTISDLQKERSFPAGMYGVKNSPYREHFRRGINLLLESGIVSRLSRLFRANKPDCDWTLEAVPFGLKPVSLAYFVFLAGLAASTVIFIVERLIRISRRRVVNSAP